MKTELRRFVDGDVEYEVLTFICPGCASIDGYSGLHMLPVTDTKGSKPTWTWNGDLEEPTLEPSILSKLGDGFVCHSYLRNGVFEFLTDSTHALSGQSAELPDLPDWSVRNDS